MNESSSTSGGVRRATWIAAIMTGLPILGSVVTLAAGPVLAPWLRNAGTMGMVYFALIFTLGGALALVPTYSVSVIAGWTFGFSRGFPLVLVCMTIGACLGYVVARAVVGKSVASVFTEHPKWEIVRRALLEESRIKTLWIVFLMRLSPVLPFGTTNALFATTGVKFSIFFVGSVLGLAPRLAVVTLASAGAERLDFKSTDGYAMLIGGVIATGVCIALLTYLGKKALQSALGAQSTGR